MHTHLPDRDYLGAPSILTGQILARVLVAEAKP